jgi:3-hydroxyisobutyrate dehydrogenase
MFVQAMPARGARRAGGISGIFGVLLLFPLPEERMRVGVIGLGIMGKPIAINLIRAGFSVTVFNRTPAKCAPLVAAGAKQAGSPAEVARNSDITITIVSDTPDVESVLFGGDGVIHGVARGAVAVDMSTISPEATVSFGSRLLEAGCALIDAPVTGGEKGAVEGTLTIMAGGDSEAFEKCRPVFAALGKTIIYTGPTGSGQKTKLVNQIVCALNILAMTEGLRFARLSGLDPQTTLKVISSGAAGSWMLSNLAPRILNDDYAPGFLIRLQQKDLRLCTEAMTAMLAKFEGTELTYRLFSEAVEVGLGEQGTQGLINLWK